MNNNNYLNYPNTGAPNYTGTMPPYQNIQNPNNGNSINLSPEEYAEDLLKLNRGKYAEFYMSYADSNQWKDRIFKGTIEDSGRDYAVLKQDDGSYVILWLIYLDFVIFPEEISHN